MNFFESIHCTSRSHCKACRTNLKFRQSICKTFDIEDENFECPHGITHSNFEDLTIKNAVRGAAGLVSDIRPDPEYPSKTKMAINAAKAVSRMAQAKLKNEVVTVSKEEQNIRLTICLQCDKYDTKNDRCKQCGCRGTWKIKLATEHCPINKW